MRAVDILGSLAVSVLRLGSGGAVGTLGARPAKRLEIYEFEACPFCRKVREALSIFDLEAVVYPCPKGGRRFRPRVRERGGKEQFPYLVDPNLDMEIYESDAIVRHLADRYGSGSIPFSLSLGPLTDLAAVASGLPRATRGVSARPSRAPAEPLELYSFEVSPFCRLVRERLCELELPYVLHNVARGSERRDDFAALSGKLQVPYLVDPNTGKSLFESADIVDYLEHTYAQ